MFTVEFEPDAAIITTLDESDMFNDVQMIIGDDNTVYIRQFDDQLEQHQMLYMSYQQLQDLFYSLQQTSGMFYVTHRG
jgi:hypothetical protein